MWFNYNCRNEFWVGLASPTGFDHNFQLGIAWKLEKCISSYCQATSLFLCIHKHWPVIGVVMLELLSEIHFCYKDRRVWFLPRAVSIYCISFLSLQCRTAPVRRAKLFKVVDVLLITDQTAQASHVIAIRVLSFSCKWKKKLNNFQRLEIQYPSAQHRLNGEVANEWFSTVCSQALARKLPPFPMLRHSSMAWPFHPSPLPCHYLQMLSAQHTL